MKKYQVTLTPDERQQLQKLITAAKASAKKLAHARILLKADAAKGGPAWSDSRIAKAIEVSTDTVARVRERFVEQGRRPPSFARNRISQAGSESWTAGPRRS
jgi:hypothetical protein